MFCEYTLELCAIALVMPAAARAATANSVFVLMFLCVYVAVCRATMTESNTTVNSFLNYF